MRGSETFEGRIFTLMNTSIHYALTSNMGRAAAIRLSIMMIAG
jgi:hypothetical protein